MVKTLKLAYYKHQKSIRYKFKSLIQNVLNLKFEIDLVERFFRIMLKCTNLLA